MTLESENSEQAIVRTVAEAAATTLMSGIPIVGPMMASTVSGAFNEARFRKLERSVDLLSVRIAGLRDDLIDSEYAHSAEYAEFILRTLDLAVRAHREERLRLLACVGAAGALRDARPLLRDALLQAAETLSSEHIDVLGLSRESRLIVDAEAAEQLSDGTENFLDLNGLEPHRERAEWEAVLAALLGGGLLFAEITLQGMRGAYSITPLGRAMLELIETTERGISTTDSPGSASR